MVCSQWRSGYNDDIASGGGCQVWHSSDTHDHADLFVLFVCLAYGHIADGTIWDINSTFAEFGPKCSHLLGIKYFTVSDTTTYLYGKGKVSALKILRGCYFPGLSTAIGELEATREQIMEAGQEFIRALYGQRRGTAVGEARYRLYTYRTHWMGDQRWHPSIDHIRSNHCKCMELRGYWRGK